MENKKLVLTIEMEGPIDSSFNASVYARGVAFRALNWCQSVKVTGENVNVMMQSDEKNRHSK